MKESTEDTELYAKRSNFTFPVLLDSEGSVAAAYAPSSVLPDLLRSDVVVASNLIIDPKGVIRFMSLLDTTSFDAKLVALREKLEELIASAD